MDGVELSSGNGALSGTGGVEDIFDGRGGASAYPVPSTNEALLGAISSFGGRTGGGCRSAFLSWIAILAGGTKDSSAFCRGTVGYLYAEETRGGMSGAVDCWRVALLFGVVPILKPIF